MTEKGIRRVLEILRDKKVPVNDIFVHENNEMFDGAKYEEIIVRNPGFDSEQLLGYLKTHESYFKKDDLVKFKTLKRFYFHKLKSLGLIYYIMEDGYELVIYIMEYENDELFMYLTGSSWNGLDEEFNKYCEGEMYIDDVDIDDDEEEDEDEKEPPWDDDLFMYYYYYLKYYS